VGDADRTRRSEPEGRTLSRRLWPPGRTASSFTTFPSTTHSPGTPASLRPAAASVSTDTERGNTITMAIHRRRPLLPALCRLPRGGAPRVFQDTRHPRRPAPVLSPGTVVGAQRALPKCFRRCSGNHTANTRSSRGHHHDGWMVTALTRKYLTGRALMPIRAVSKQNQYNDWGAAL